MTSNPSASDKDWETSGSFFARLEEGPGGSMLEGKNREICLGGGVAFLVGLSIRFPFPFPLLPRRMDEPE